MKQVILLIIALLSIFSFAQVQAQTVPVEQLISIQVVPENPRENEDVSIEIESYSYDLSRARISWYINDTLRDSGIGKKIFTFRTGEIGSVSRIRYQIATVEGTSFDKSLTISPGNVTLLWESTGYVPPFFKGKSLFSYEGIVRIIAIPNLLKSNGTKYKPEELVYTWKRGMGTDTGASGYGKYVFLWGGNIVSSPEDIEVEVSNLEGTTKANAVITIEPERTEILAYENNPSLGILFNKAVNSTFNMKSLESSFVAMPYYFNNPDNEGKYSWFVNGNKSPETSKYITFRNTTEEEGFSRVSFDLSGQTKILQSAASGFDIYFGVKKNNSVGEIFKGFFGN